MPAALLSIKVTVFCEMFIFRAALSKLHSAADKYPPAGIRLILLPGLFPVPDAQPDQQPGHQSQQHAPDDIFHIRTFLPYAVWRL